VQMQTVTVVKGHAWAAGGVYNAQTPLFDALPLQ
jgi:hypothetical protein